MSIPVYVWQAEDQKWRWACPQRNEAATMPQYALSWHSALVSAECSLGLDRSQMNIHHNRKPPENSSQTVETVETTTDTGDQRNTAPEQSESVLDHGPVTRSLQVTDYQWELLMEAVHLLKAKTDKNVHAFEHVAKITLEGPSLKAVQAGHEAHLKAQEELAIMILALDPEGVFAKGL